MLTKNVETVVNYIKSHRINPVVPTRDLQQALDKFEMPDCVKLIVWDFEDNDLFYANESARAFLGFDPAHDNKYKNTFLENVMHPVTLQLLQFDTRLFRQKNDEAVNNVLCLKSECRDKFAWVYASIKVAGYTPYGKPKLIYICFIEVEKAVQSYVKIMNNSDDNGLREKPLSMLNALRAREIEILSLISAEFTSKEIATKLNITQAAVDAARKRLIQKLGVKSVVGLVKVALSLGLNGNEDFSARQKSFDYNKVRAFPFNYARRASKKVAGGLDEA